MEGFGDLIGALPPWAQGVAVVVLGVLGVLLGKKAGRKKSSSSAGGSRRNSSTHDARLRDDGSRDDTQSPGRAGSGATRDLTAAEISTLQPSYQPDPDGAADPGEVVWTWVPYAEHDGRGKDRPVLIIARIDGTTTAGCYLSTKEHRGFVSLGSGAWDPQGRESFLAPERVLRISDEGVRREGHLVSRDRFIRAVEAIQQVHRP